MEQKTQNKKQKTRSRGFTLLLAALVASIALSLGAAIYSIVSKELQLSSIGQDSQYAFYAADTAAECALYWDNRSDIHPNTFATSSTDAGTAASVTCDGQTAPVTIAASSPTAATSTFEVDLFTDVSGGYCADVSVGKTFNSQTNADATLVISNGYNVSCAQVDTAPNALQRTVQLEY
jgi:hypothetical protein